MTKPIQMGCKKCGSVISLEIRTASNRYELRATDATVSERLGRVQVLCKKCRAPVASVSIEPT